MVYYPKPSNLTRRYEMKNIKIIFLTILTISILLSGCQTIGGMGRDIQAGGRAISTAASH